MDKWNEKKYREFVLNILNRACSYDNYRRVRISEAFDHYYGTSRGNSYDDLLNYTEVQRSSKGNTPYHKMNFDSISPKLNIMLGELNGKGFEIDISGISMDAIRRRKIFESQMEFQMNMQALYQKASAETGVDYGVNASMPQDHESLRAYMDSYKDVYDLLMQESVNDDIYLYGYSEMRKNFMLDLLCSNEIHAKNEFRNGVTYPRRINPMNCIPDLGTEDDYFSDAQYFIEARYVTIPDATKFYNVPRKKLNELIKRYEEGDVTMWKGVSGGNGSVWQPFLASTENGNYDRVLIFEVEFKNARQDKLKVTKDSHGNTHVHKYEGYHNSAKLTKKEQEVEGNELLSKNVEIVRKCALIGGYIVTDTGIVENNRSFDSPARSPLSYTSVIHNYNNQASVSLVDRMGKISDFKNYVLTLMQKEITTAIGSYVVIDTAYVDSEIYGTGKAATEKVLHNLKQYKLLYVNSAQHKDKRSQGLPIKDAPAKVQALVREAIEVSMFCDRELEKISGINEARQGGGGERALASTQELKLSQSNMTTDTYFQSFYAWERRLWEKHIERTSILWVKNPEKYEHIAARLGIDIPEDFEMDLQKFRVEVTQLPITKAELKSMVELSLSQGNLLPQDAIRINLLIHKNVKDGLKLYVDLADKRREEEMGSRQRENEALSKGELATKQYERETKMMEIDRKGQIDMERDRLKQGVLDKTTKLNLEQKDRSAVAKRSAEIEKLMATSDK